MSSNHLRISFYRHCYFPVCRRLSKRRLKRRELFLGHPIRLRVRLRRRITRRTHWKQPVASMKKLKNRTAATLATRNSYSQPNIPYSETNSEPKGQVVGLLEENRRLRNQVKSVRAWLAVKRNALKSLNKQGKQLCSNFGNTEMYPTKEIYF